MTWRPMRRNSATENSLAGSAMSIMWWGTPVPLQEVRLRGADVHAPIDLHRVDRDDLGAKSLGQPGRPRRSCRPQLGPAGPEPGSDPLSPPGGAALEATTSTSKKDPDGCPPSTWTNLLVRVRVVATFASRFDGPSLSTSTLRPPSPDCADARSGPGSRRVGRNAP